MFLFVWFCIEVLLFFYLFFFKQKTAYEMRISDWSSDVCSSDLVLLSQRRDRKRYHLRIRQRFKFAGRRRLQKRAHEESDMERRLPRHCPKSARSKQNYVQNSCEPSRGEDCRIFARSPCDLRNVQNRSRHGRSLSGRRQ